MTISADVASQTAATWFSAYASAAAAAATVAAVGAALWIPYSHRRQQTRQGNFAVRNAALGILGLRQRLETELMNLKPAEELEKLLLVRDVANYYLARDTPDVRTVAALLTIRPKIDETVNDLEKWCAHMHGQASFSIEGFRYAMSERSVKIRKVMDHLPR